MQVYFYFRRILKCQINLTKGKVGNEMYKNEKTYNKNRQKIKNARKSGVRRKYTK